MANQFSPKVSQILAFSREEAARLASSSVGPEHLLLGLLRETEGPVRDSFLKFDIDLFSVKQELEQRVREDTIRKPMNIGEIVLNEKASNILRLAVLEARMQQTGVVDVQHLLLAILHDQVNNGAKEVLENYNMNYSDTLEFLKHQASPTTRNGLGLPEEDEEDDGQ